MMTNEIILNELNLFNYLNDLTGNEVKYFRVFFLKLLKKLPKNNKHINLKQELIKRNIVNEKQYKNIMKISNNITKSIRKQVDIFLKDSDKDSERSKSNFFDNNYDHNNNYNNEEKNYVNVNKEKYENFKKEIINDLKKYRLPLRKNLKILFYAFVFIFSIFFVYMSLFSFSLKTIINLTNIISIFIPIFLIFLFYLHSLNYSLNNKKFKNFYDYILDSFKNFIRLNFYDENFKINEIFLVISYVISMIIISIFTDSFLSNLFFLLFYLKPVVDLFISLLNKNEILIKE